MVSTKAHPKPNRWWRRFVVLFTIILVMGLVYIAYRTFFYSQSMSTNVVEQSTVSGTSARSPFLAESTQSTKLIAIAAEGELVPLRSANLSFTMSGQVESLAINEADKVEAQQILISLDASDLQATVMQAEAAIHQVQASLKAAQAQVTMAQARADLCSAQLDAAQAGVTIREAQWSLAEANLLAVSTEAPVIIQQAQAGLAEAEARRLQAQATVRQAQASEQEAQAAIVQAEAAVAEARAALEQAEAARRLAEAQLAKTVLRAPFAGQIASINVEIGEVINPAHIAIKLANLDTWLIRTTDLTEIDVVNLKLGQRVAVTLDALPVQTLTGIITEIANVAVMKRGDVTYDVTVALEDNADLPLRWGMTAFINFNAP